MNDRIKRELEAEKENPQSSTLLESRPSEEEKLIDTIFLKRDYGFYLGLKTPLDLPLYKDRNFNLELGLYDREHNPIGNSNSILTQKIAFLCRWRCTPARKSPS